MITIIGAVIGLFSSGLPDLLGFFKAKQDDKQELAILELQTKRDAAGHGYKMSEISAEADVRETEAIHREFAQRRETWKWVESCISLVRPTITYGFFALYSAVKYAQVFLALRATDDWMLALPAIWHEQDAAIFATIIGFWFGTRSLQKFRKGR